MDLEPNNTGMFSEREHRPIAEMLIQRNKDSGIGYGTLKNLGIIGTLLTDLGRPHDVVAFAPKRLGDFDPQTLV